MRYYWIIGEGQRAENIQRAGDWPGCCQWQLQKATLELKNGSVEQFYLPPPMASFNRVIASDMVTGNGAITDRLQGTAYQNWRLNFHKQKAHSCSLKLVTVLHAKSNLTRNTSWEPGSLLTSALVLLKVKIPHQVVELKLTGLASYSLLKT